MGETLFQPAFLQIIRPFQSIFGQQRHLLRLTSNIVRSWFKKRTTCLELSFVLLLFTKDLKLMHKKFLCCTYFLKRIKAGYRFFVPISLFKVSRHKRDSQMFRI